MVFLKSSSCSGSHAYATFFLSSWRMWDVACDRSGRKELSWFASPRNDFTSFADFGCGNCFIASIFSGSGFTPSLPTRYPANMSSSPTSSFVSDMRIPCSLHLSSTISRRVNSVSQSGACTRRSSISLSSQSPKPSNAVSVRMLKTSPLMLRPMGAPVYLYLPEGIRNVVRSELLGSSGIWKYPCVASTFANTLDVGFICFMRSLAAVNGWIGLFTAEFSLLKSTTMRHFFLSALGTKCAGEHHVVGCDTFSITPASRSSLTSLSAASLICMGMGRVVVTWIGLTSVSLLILIVMGGPFIDPCASFSLSPSMSAYSALSWFRRRAASGGGPFVVVVALACWSRYGKLSSITFNLIRSCHDRSMSSCRSSDTMACMSAVRLW